ncbi:Hypothetical predicted protein [Paramuricea clavata]|uniref:Uncharacterized protein n=1 Tax=Paramuricea clavata TaxID=317549 RepID=A0A6S7GGD7_PARCT|nr:Hypothetical predicted protein [Paramuricea clavata]
MSTISSTVEKLNERMTSLESARVKDTDNMAAEQDDTSCPEPTDVSDQLSIAVPPDAEIESFSPVILDPNFSHKVGNITSKSLTQGHNNDTTCLSENNNGGKNLSERRIFVAVSPDHKFLVFLEETSLPDLDVFTTPKLDKPIADQIQKNYKKSVENQPPFPNAGKQLFGEDITKITADSADIVRNLQKTESTAPTNIFVVENTIEKILIKKPKFSPDSLRPKSLPSPGEGQISIPAAALSRQAKQQLPLAGRLSFFIKNWLNITQDSTILEIVQGYQIQFHSPPIQKTVPRPSLQNCKLVSEEIEALLHKDAIKRVHFNDQAFYHRIFLVAKKGGGQRPVLDLSPLNKFIQTEHFKMENLMTIKSHKGII